MSDQLPPPRPEFSVPTERYYVQLALGQIHGVMHKAVTDAPEWLPQSTDEPTVAISFADLDAAYLEACRQLGVVQYALNTGEADSAVASVGLNGPQLWVKLKGFWQSIQHFAHATPRAARAYLTRMQSALGWSGTIVGSLTTGFEKELTKIPGAAAAAEGLKEFLEVLQHAAEERRSSPSADASPEIRATSPAKPSGANRDKPQTKSDD